MLFDVVSAAQVAVKLEKTDSPHPQLVYESRVLRCIHQHGVATGFPLMHWMGEVSTELIGMVRIWRMIERRRAD